MTACGAGVIFNHRLYITLVGCDVAAHVTSAGVLSDTYRGKQCELFTKKGGITSFMPRPFTRAGLFLCANIREEAEENVSEQALDACFHVTV